MGTYTKNLFKNKKPRTVAQQKSISKETSKSVHHNKERLVSCAIKRNDVVHSYGFKSHADIRRKLGDDDYYASKAEDEEGFLTSNERFVSREEANKIGFLAGQCQSMSRKFLSSDVDRW